MPRFVGDFKLIEKTVTIPGTFGQSFNTIRKYQDRFPPFDDEPF